MCMFQRRHYEAIAAVIRATKVKHAKRHKDDFPGVEIMTLERQLITLFQADNHRFRPGAFSQACEVTNDE